LALVKASLNNQRKVQFYT